MTPSGIEPVTFRHAVQFLNQLLYSVPLSSLRSLLMLSLNFFDFTTRHFTPAPSKLALMSYLIPDSITGQYVWFVGNKAALGQVFIRVN